MGFLRDPLYKQHVQDLFVKTVHTLAGPVDVNVETVRGMNFCPRYTHGQVATTRAKKFLGNTPFHGDTIAKPPPVPRPPPPQPHQAQKLPLWVYQMKTKGMIVSMRVMTLMQWWTSAELSPFQTQIGKWTGILHVQRRIFHLCLNVLMPSAELRSFIQCLRHPWFPTFPVFS